MIGAVWVEEMISKWRSTVGRGRASSHLSHHVRSPINFASKHDKLLLQAFLLGAWEVGSTGKVVEGRQLRPSFPGRRG